MKILQINFSNLNSLKGDFSIDLSSGTLHEAGIFAICGPTGSGKSTILDAITLALFGKAARYDDGTNVQNMMSRGTWESKATIVFETHNKVYTSKWMLKRAHKNPDGKFQGVKREISDSSGKILHSRISSIDSFVAQESGLDYKRFLRSVLLAQGQFKEFLDANAKARGELLEKITGTEIYSDLGKLCFSLSKEKGLEIKKLRTKVEHLELLQDQDRDTLNLEQNQLLNTIKDIKSKLVFYDLQQSKYKALSEHRTNESHIQQKILDLQPLITQEAIASKKLLKHNQTQEFQKDVFSIDSNILRQKESQSQIEQLTNKIPKATSLLNDLNNSLKDFYTKQSDQYDQKLKANLSKILNFQNLLKISNTWINDNSFLPLVSKQYSNIKVNHTAVLETQTKIDLKKSFLKTQETKAKILESESLLSVKDSKQFQDIYDNLCKELKTQKDQYQDLTKDSSLKDFQLKIKNNRNIHSKLQDLSNQLELYKNAQFQLDSIVKQLNEETEIQNDLQLELDKAVKDYEQQSLILKDKQKILNLSLKIDSLTKQRSGLIPNEECPLCGSLDHPYSTGVELSLDHDQINYDKQNKHVQRLLQTRSSLETRLKLNSKTLQKLQQDIDKESPLLQDQSSSIRILLEKFSWHEQNLTGKKLIDIISTESKTIETELTLLEKTVNDIIIKKENIDAKTLEISEAQKTLDSKLLNKRQNEKLLFEINESIGDSKKQLKILESSLTTDTNIVIEQLAQCHYTFNPKNMSILVSELDTGLASLQTHEKEVENIQSQIQLTNKDQDYIQEQISLIENKLGLLDIKSTEYRLVKENTAHQYEKRINDGNQHLGILNEKLQEQSKFQKTISIQIDDERTKINTRLATSGFNDLDTLKAATLTTKEQNEIQELLDQIKRENSAIETLKSQNEKSYIKHQLATIDSSDSPKILQEITDLQNSSKQQVEELNQRLGQISNIFLQDKIKKDQVSTIIQEIDDLKEKYKDWFMMNTLIGSAEGDSFSKFAQGLTLQRLVTIANQHLFKLNPRYQIQRSKDKELEVEIIDLYQANSIRPTKSLSGGESFLLSLSLALSLSELSSHKNPIRSLFIDEGFGSLDSDTLDIALSALENLRHDNRMIGVISHVDTLKQRIHAKIEVQRQSNGNSSIHIS